MSFCGTCTERMSSDDFGRCAREFIDVTDKYNIVGLNLEAEAEYVERLEIMAENAVDMLLYVDAKHLTLLIERAMIFASKNQENILASESVRGMPSV